MKYKHISVAIPVLAEYDNLPRLVESLRCQTLSDFSVYCCVNNCEGWADDCDEYHHSVFCDNQMSLNFLRQFPFKILDYSSVGNGWRDKQQGVGWARKVLFEAIAEGCDDNEIIVSLDADTVFSETYLESVIDVMNGHPDRSAICVPYYHPLSGDDNTDRSMLRYEMYMRYYFLSLKESGNPYAFTALGSAMVFPLWAYRRVGGITPLQGGEDFYLMQKFAKTGTIILSCNEVVRPQGRSSVRVPFGTGPAIAKGIDFIEAAYPFYPFEGFRAVDETYALFPRLYSEEIETPMSDFLRQQLKTESLWQPLRKNFKNKELFVHACQERVDGLRILQYLKTFPLRASEDELQEFCCRYRIDISSDFSFRTSPVREINTIRDALFAIEQRERR